MPTTFGSLRRLGRTPSLAEVSVAGRGSQVTSTDAAFTAPHPVP